MEDGSSLGTYVAYALIGLFLLVVVLAVVRTMMLPAFLLLEPIRHFWTWLGRRRAASAKREHASKSISEF